MKFESCQYLLGHAKENISFDLQSWSENGLSAFVSIDHDLWKIYLDCSEGAEEVEEILKLDDCIDLSMRGSWLTLSTHKLFPGTSLNCIWPPVILKFWAPSKKPPDVLVIDYWWVLNIEAQFVNIVGISSNDYYLVSCNRSWSKAREDVTSVTLMCAVSHSIWPWHTDYFWCACAILGAMGGKRNRNTFKLGTERRESIYGHCFLESLLLSATLMQRPNMLWRGMNDCHDHLSG